MGFTRQKIGLTWSLARFDVYLEIILFSKSSDFLHENNDIVAVRLQGGLEGIDSLAILFSMAQLGEFGVYMYNYIWLS